MKRQYALAVAWVVGMLLAPDNLILLGNGAGSVGAGIVLLLIGSVCVYILHSRCYKNIAAYRQGPAGEFQWISDTLNSAAAVIFSIVPRVLTAVFLATATLVASGFVFNEVFVQRFPNFAFAFLLLGALLAINLYSRKLSGKIQLLLCAAAIGGLLILSVTGIFKLLKAGETLHTVAILPPLKGSFSVLLLFIGFDLLTLSREQYADNAPHLQRPLLLGLLLAGTIFGLWGAASFLFVPSEQLADTTIPHILAAKKILGQTGRIIMGVVIIAGTGAAVNALFRAIGEMIADLSTKKILPFLPRFFNRPFWTIILLALATATMMAFGFAGTDALDTYIQGSLILWLLNYALLNLALLLPGGRRVLQSSQRLSWRQTAAHGAIAMLMLIGSAVLIATDDNVGLLIRYLGIILFAIGLPVWAGSHLQSRRHRSHNIDDN